MCRQPVRCQMGTRTQDFTLRTSKTQVNALCVSATLVRWRNGDLAPLTITHKIFLEERTAEPTREHMKIHNEAGKQLLEVRVGGTKISKGSSHKYSMGVKPKEVVVTGIQIPSFHEL